MLLLLEASGLPHRLPLRVLRALVRRESVPPLIHQTLSRHKNREVREGAKYYVKLPDPHHDRSGASAAGPALATQRGHLPEMLELGLVPDWLLETVASTADSYLRNALLRASSRLTAAPHLQDVGQLLRRASGEWGTYWKYYSFTSKEYRYHFGHAALTAAEATRLAGGGPAW